MTGSQAVNLELHIEELVLHGLEHVDRAQIGRAVEQKLWRLIAEGGAPRMLTTSREIGQIAGGEFDLTYGSTATEIGNQVAEAVYGSMQQ
jgi:hypothetical protein